MPALTAANGLVRARNVTASEVAALMPGGHPYTSPERIWDRLMGVDAVRESEQMTIGSWFEATILRYAEQRDGFRARLNARSYEHPSVRLAATPDAFVVSPRPGLFVPERALIEIKMSGRVDQWRELPEHVRWQARAQLACTGRDVVYVYALVGMHLTAFDVYRDAGLEAQLTEAVDRFWRDHVVARVRPEPAEPVPPLTFSFEAGPIEQEAIAP